MSDSPDSPQPPTAPGREVGAESPFPTPLELPERGLSLVWLVPLVAAIIAAWIGVKSWNEQGPTLQVTFRSAEGIEPRKTRVRYHNVELGRVEKMSLGADRNTVVVSIEMSKEAEPLLNASTRFWVVRPRIDTGGISGLSTLVSGAYIELDPGSREPDSTRHFKGLDAPPVIATDAPGQYFRLIARQLGSIGVKAPVYHRRIQVGEVVSFHLREDGSAVEVQLFINAPYHTMVHENTRFWHAGGIEASLDADGFQLRTEPVLALMAGGISFGIPQWEEPTGTPAPERVFELLESRAEAEERHFAQRERFLLHFDSSIRGLQKGAPVEFLGMAVGRVHSFDLEVRTDPVSWHLPVVIEIEPRRFGAHNASAVELLSALVEHGLRARLKSGNLLTGKLYVALEMDRGSSPATLITGGAYPAIPTLPGNVEEIAQRLDRLMTRIEQLPVEAIAANLEGLLKHTDEILNSPELRETLALAQRSLQQLEQLIGAARGDIDGLTTDARSTLQGLDRVLTQSHSTLTKLEQGMLDERSEFRYQLGTTLDEVSRTARALRSLVEYFERNPNALILGKQAQ